VVEEVLVPEVVKNAPSLWRRIGEEVSDQLDFEPARFWRRRLVRPKYVHRLEVDETPAWYLDPSYGKARQGYL